MLTAHHKQTGVYGSGPKHEHSTHGEHQCPRNGPCISSKGQAEGKDDESAMEHDHYAQHFKSLRGTMNDTQPIWDFYFKFCFNLNKAEEQKLLWCVWLIWAICSTPALMYHTHYRNKGITHNFSQGGSVLGNRLQHCIMLLHVDLQSHTASAIPINLKGLYSSDGHKLPPQTSTKKRYNLLTNNTHQNSVSSCSHPCPHSSWVPAAGCCPSAGIGFLLSNSRVPWLQIAAWSKHLSY